MLETYAGFNFGLNVAKDLLDHRQILTHGKQYKRREISTLLLEGFLRHGGTEENIPSDPARTVKTVFPKRGESNERFKDIGYGYYKYIGQGSGTTVSTAVSSPNGNPNGLTPDRTWGTGPYEVYAWCLPQDANTADRWPIKIGFAGEGGFRRRWEQDFATHLPVLPRYLRSFRYDTETKARKAEGHLHGMLGDDGHRRRVQGIPATEWFLTSPDEIDGFMLQRYPHFASNATVGDNALA